MTLREISYTRVHSGNDIERARARNEINTEKDKEGEENRGKNNELTGVHFFFFFTLLFTTWNVRLLLDHDWSGVLLQ